MSVTLAGWKYDELITKLFTCHIMGSWPHALSIILGYLVCWCWHAYFKPKDHYIIGGPYGATILDRIMKNETANPPPPPPSTTSPNHGWHRAKTKMHHFPILVWSGGGINFPSISYKHRRQPAKNLILITQDFAMKFLPQAAQYHGHLWRQTHDDKLVKVSGIFRRPGSLTSSVLTKL